MKNRKTKDNNEQIKRRIKGVTWNVAIAIIYITS